MGIASVIVLTTVTMGIAALIVLMAVTAFSPWLGEETRPGLDERSETERFGMLR